MEIRIIEFSSLFVLLLVNTLREETDHDEFISNPVTVNKRLPVQRFFLQRPLRHKYVN